VLLFRQTNFEFEDWKYRKWGISNENHYYPTYIIHPSWKMTIATNKQDLSITENKITGIEGTENAKENASSGFKLTLVSKYISFHLA